MNSNNADVLPIAAARCRRGCPFRGATRDHHDRLLHVDWDHAPLMELMELAVTWGELEYGEQAVIPPERWMDFVAAHRWRDADQAERILLMASDVALRVRRSAPVQRLSLAR
jgi:hypothetical protein